MSWKNQGGSSHFLPRAFLILEKWRKMARMTLDGLCTLKMVFTEPNLFSSNSSENDFCGNHANYTLIFKVFTLHVSVTVWNSLGLNQKNFKFFSASKLLIEQLWKKKL